MTEKSMDEKRDLAWKALIEHTSERVLEIITDYHGMQIFSDGFIEHLVDEGIIDDEG
jgi:hypothetical protein